MQQPGTVNRGQLFWSGAQAAMQDRFNSLLNKQWVQTAPFGLTVRTSCCAGLPAIRRLEHRMGVTGLAPACRPFRAARPTSSYLSSSWPASNFRKASCTTLARPTSTDATSTPSRPCGFKLALMLASRGASW